MVYLGASVLNKAAPFIMLPLVTRYLTPTEYGVLSMFIVLNGLFMAVVGMNMSVNISKNFYSVSKSSLSEIIGNMMFILICSSVLIGSACLVVTAFYDQIFSVPVSWWLCFPMLSLFTMLHMFNLTVLRNEERPWMYGMYEIGNTLLMVSATLWFLVYVKSGWYSQVLGMVLSQGVFSILSVVYLSRRGYVRFKLSIGTIRSILRISMPLVPHLLGGMVILVSDRLFIEQMIGVHEVALYSVGYSFGMILAVFTDAFIKAWSPWFYRKLANPTDEIKVRVVKYTYMYGAGILLIAFVVTALAKLVITYMIPEEFFGANEYVLWVSLGYVVHGIYKIFFPYLVYLNKTSFLALSTAVAAITNLVLNYIFILYFGAIGAAYATFASYFICAVAVFEFQRRKFSMPWLALWGGRGAHS